MMNFLDIWRGGKSPFQDEWDLMRRNFDRSFGDAMKTMERIPEMAAFAPACDIEETNGGYLMTVDLPGVPKDAVKIEVIDDVLTVTGERSEEKRDKKHRVIERFSGKFERSLRLPPGIKYEDIKASYENGVLKIEIPKAEAAKRKQIPVGESKGAVAKNGKEEKGRRVTVAA